MPTLLRIDASPRGADAHSARIGNEVVERLRLREPGLNILHRRLAVTPPPHIDAAFAAAMRPHQTKESAKGVAALAHSELLIEELECSDRLLISTPMHNYTVPATLKAWIDQVLRFGRTFDSTPDGKIGKLQDRPTWIVVASGGHFTGERARQPDFLTGYLAAVLATIGIRDVTFIKLEALNRTPEALEEAYRTARTQVARSLG